MDDLDFRYRRIIGEDTSDFLIQHHVKLDLLFKDRIGGHMAFGHMGGADWGPNRTRTLVCHGRTPTEAARGLVERTPPHYRPQSLRSATWALEQAAHVMAHREPAPEPGIRAAMLRCEWATDQLTGALQHGR
jgi:hypothetical protein